MIVVLGAAAGSREFVKKQGGDTAGELERASRVSVDSRQWRVHEENGAPAWKAKSDKLGGAKVGVQEFVMHLNTSYRSAQGEIGLDDPNNCLLNANLIRDEGEVELAYFGKQGVYTKLPRSAVFRSNAKMFQLRWVDTNK